MVPNLRPTLRAPEPRECIPYDAVLSGARPGDADVRPLELSLQLGRALIHVETTLFSFYLASVGETHDHL